MNSTNSRPIRVLIADSDPLVCRALLRLLRDSAQVEVIATAEAGDEVVEMARQFHPAVVLVDINTDGVGRLDGVKLTQRLCREMPATRVIALGVYAPLRDQALIAGACRFLLKDCNRDTLVAAILSAAKGECQAVE